MINLQEMIDYQCEMMGRPSTGVYMRLLHDAWQIVEVLEVSSGGECKCEEIAGRYAGCILEFDIDDLIPYD